MKILTIYTDASYIHQRNVGAIAWFLHSDAGSLIGSKVCPVEITDILLGEMYAMAQALHTADRTWGLQNFDKIIFNCDSIGAIRNMKVLKRPTKRPIHLRIFKAFHRLTKDRSVEFRHVKAHQGTDTRSWVNQLVDRKCRKTARDHVLKLASVPTS